MKLRDLSTAERRSRLRRGDLVIQQGPFWGAVRTSLASLERAIELLYGNYHLADESGFADFHVGVTAKRYFFRPWRREVHVLHSGEPLSLELSPDLTVAGLEWAQNSCIGRLSYNYLTMHAAALERDGRCIMLVGSSGAGKSTLCAALALRGWRLLSDEFGLISTDTNQLTPVPRPISLKGPSIDVIRRLAPEVTIGPVGISERRGPIAHMRAPSSAVESAHRTAPPGSIFLIRYQQDASLRMESISKARCLHAMAQNAMNYNVLGELGFATLANTVEHCDCHRLTYGDIHKALDWFEAAAYAPQEMAHA